jgi:GxxExxY protein
MTKKYLNELTYNIVGAAIEVQKEIGPGLLENIYHHCIVEEFRRRGIRFQSQLYIPITYKGVELNADLRCDFLIENAVVVELKAIVGMLPLFDAQVISYMKLLEVPKGILLNFHSVNLFREGQKTFVNEIFRGLPDE